MQARKTVLAFTLLPVLLALVNCGSPSYLEVLGRTGVGPSESGAPLIYVQPCGGEKGQIDRVTVVVSNGQSSNIPYSEFVADQPTQDAFVLDPSDPPPGWSMKGQLQMPVDQWQSVDVFASSSEREVQTVMITVDLGRVAEIESGQVLIEAVLDSNEQELETIPVGDFQRCN